MATPPLTAALFVELFEGVLLVPSRWQHLHTRSSWQQHAKLISDNNNYSVHLTGHFGATSRRCLRRSMIRFLAAIFLFGHFHPKIHAPRGGESETLTAQRCAIRGLISPFHQCSTGNNSMATFVSDTRPQWQLGFNLSRRQKADRQHWTAVHTDGNFISANCKEFALSAGNY